MLDGNSDLNPNTTNSRHLDHAVRTGLVSAGFIGTIIGILYGLTHSAQIGVALTDAIDLYGGSSGVSFNTGSPVIAFVVSIIPAVIGAEAKPLRDRPNFFLGRPGMQTTGHCGVALGAGRRALDEVTELAQNKERGYKGAELLVANRGPFQQFLGESDLRLRVAKALCVETLEEAWGLVCPGITPPLPLQVRLRASGTHATEKASDIVSQAFRFGGGSAMYSFHILQKCLRDIHGVAQRNMVSDRAYENHVQFMLGFPGANPMG